MVSFIKHTLASAKHTRKIKFLSSQIQYDNSGTYPMPVGGDSNLWINGNGAQNGSLQIWFNNSGKWVLIGQIDSASTTPPLRPQSTAISSLPSTTNSFNTVNNLTIGIP